MPELEYKSPEWWKAHREALQQSAESEGAARERQRREMHDPVARAKFSEWWRAFCRGEK